MLPALPLARCCRTRSIFTLARQQESHTDQHVMGGVCSEAALAAIRLQCSSDNQALVCRLTDTCSLLLVPLPPSGTLAGIDASSASASLRLGRKPAFTSRTQPWLLL